MERKWDFKKQKVNFQKLKYTNNIKIDYKKEIFKNKIFYFCYFLDTDFILTTTDPEYYK